MEVKRGAGVLSAPKICLKKVLTNVSGCTKIVATENDFGIF